MDEDEVQENLHDEEETSTVAEMKDGTSDKAKGKKEKDSEESVSKVANATSKAPARKGDKSNSEKMHKLSGKMESRAGKIGALFSEMNKMSPEDLNALYSAMMEESDDVETDEEEVAESVYDYSEDMNALVESEATLSEDFKKKTTVIFEAALNSRVKEEVTRLEEAFNESLEETTEQFKNDMEEKVASYLDYVVEQWAEENKVAITAGLRTEIAEDFMSSLKDLFVESYIEVPESKVDLVDELSEEVEKLSGQLDETLSVAVAQSKEIEEYARKQIVAEAAEGLSDTDSERLVSLTENVSFDDEESFAEKIASLKESYFEAGSTKKVSLEEDADDASSETEVISENMQRYVDAVRKTR